MQAASDPMDAACDAVQLSWVLRRALGLLSTLEVEDTADTFITRIKAGGVMDVVERSGSYMHTRRCSGLMHSPSMQGVTQCRLANADKGLQLGDLG